METLSIRTNGQLDQNMRLSWSNLNVIELVKMKEDLPTLNDALSLIIETYRPFLKSRSIGKRLDKKGVSSLQQDTQEQVDDTYEYNKETKKDY